MNGRERLINLLDGADAFLRNRADSSPAPLNEFDIEALHDIANLCDEAARMLEKAIVSPCRVGDKVYYISFRNNIVECNVFAVEYTEKETVIKCCVWNKECEGLLHKQFVYFNLEDVGKTVFPTRKEAEAKLKESDNG